MVRYTACVRCGDFDVRPLTVSSGLVAGGGEVLRMECARCGWQGVPIEFDTAQDLAAYQAERRGQPTPPEVEEPAPVPDKVGSYGGAFIGIAFGFIALAVAGALIMMGHWVVALFLLAFGIPMMVAGARQYPSRS